MLRRTISVLILAALLVPLLAAQDKQSDDRIYDEVRRRLANDAEVKGAALDVTVTKGAVTLRGQVHTEKAREKAAAIAKKVKGVTTVDNQLKLFGAT
jgi:hyperosmotically inducible protein